MDCRTEDQTILKICLEQDKSSSERMAEISAALENVTEQRLPRCITILGTGEEFLTGEDSKGELRRVLDRLDQLRVPVILGINGRCSGMGMELLRYADLAVASGQAIIEGCRSPEEAEESDVVNRTVPGQALADTLEDYAMRLAAVPEPLITFGHNLYFALEKLPDRLARSQYGAGVIGDIMAIQAALNADRPQQAALGKTESQADGIQYRNDYDKTHAILFEIRNNVEYIQLNAPQTHNMLDWRTSMELAGAYALANALPELKAIVVTGVGRWFHLGGIRYCQEDAYERERFADQLRLRNQIMREIHVPLISAVNGECSGGGMSLVLKSDRVIAAEDALFGYPEVKHNGFACNSMVNTMDIIPKKAALNMFYFGELFSARKAKQYGIVHEIVSREELGEAVQRALSDL